MESHSGLTRASQKYLAKVVTMNELHEGAVSFGDARKAWEQKMIAKYGLTVK